MDPHEKSYDIALKARLKLRFMEVLYLDTNLLLVAKPGNWVG